MSCNSERNPQDPSRYSKNTHNKPSHKTSPSTLIHSGSLNESIEKRTEAFFKGYFSDNLKKFLILKEDKEMSEYLFEKVKNNVHFK